jgi:hypothetical protein
VNEIKRLTTDSRLIICRLVIHLVVTSSETKIARNMLFLKSNRYRSIQGLLSTLVERLSHERALHLVVRSDVIAWLNGNCVTFQISHLQIFSLQISSAQELILIGQDDPDLTRKTGGIFSRVT